MRALRDEALLAAGAWAVEVLLIALGDVLSEGNPAPILWARFWIVLVALSLRAPVSLSGNLDDVTVGGFSLIADFLDELPDNATQASASLTFVPLAFTALLVVAVFLTTRRAGGASASATTRDRALRALLTGAAFGVAAALLAVVLSGPVMPGSEIRLGAGAFQAALGGMVIVGLAAFWGYGSGAHEAARLPLLWRLDLRTGAEFVMTVLPPPPSSGSVSWPWPRSVRGTCGMPFRCWASSASRTVREAPSGCSSWCLSCGPR